MAADEAILEAVAAGEAPPTLRFYAWAPACLSLGYAQRKRDVDFPRLRQLEWDLVRRPTGGRAILHTDELTYSVIAPMDEPRVRGGVIESYRRLSQGLIAGLECLGLAIHAGRKAKELLCAAGPGPVCFEVPSDYEITAGGKKLLGSAQVRKQGVVLQHGSLPLVGDIARICDALVFPSETERTVAKIRVRERATTVAAVLGTDVSWFLAAEALAEGFSGALNLDLEPGELSASELARRRRLHEEKYAAAVWNERV